MQDDFEFKVEEMIDNVGLSEMLRVVSRICDGKADHLRSNWQDDKAAVLYGRWARQIEQMAERIYAHGQ